MTTHGIAENSAGTARRAVDRSAGATAPAASSWFCWLPPCWSPPPPALWCWAAATPSRTSSAFSRCLPQSAFFRCSRSPQASCGCRRREPANPLIKSLVDDAFDGILVTDGDGRVIYANAAYLDLIDAADANDMRPVERVFIGDADASEAIYRLLKAAREGKRLQEEVRVAGIKGRPARWLRLRVRPLGESSRARRLTVWSLSDVTRERERQENVFQELQHAIDYLDHAPAGFFSVDAKGDVVYLNATLANWLDQDLAQVGSGGLKLADLVAGDGAALLTTLRAAPGEIKTEVLDLDLKTRSGRTLPVRLVPQAGLRRRRCAGRLAHAGHQSRAAMTVTDPLRAAEIRFMRFFHNTPMAIATVDRDGRIVRTNPLFVAAVSQCAQRRRRGPLDRRRSCRARPACARSGHRPGRRRQQRHRAGRRSACRRAASVSAVSTSPRLRRRSAIRKPPSSICSKRPRSVSLKPKSPNSRRWSSSASSPAALRTISTTFSPPSSWRRIFFSTRTSRPIPRSATSCRSSRMPTGRRAWFGICSPSRASRRCGRRCSTSARS